MSNNLRSYRAIWDALTPWYPGQPTGTVARRVPTLAALLSGSVGSKSPQRPRVATQIPDGTQPAGRVVGRGCLALMLHVISKSVSKKVGIGCVCCESIAVCHPDNPPQPISMIPPGQGSNH